MRLSAERAIYFPLLKYAKPPEVSGYALRWKSHIHYGNQTLSHREQQSPTSPLQRAGFWLKTKFFLCEKNMPLQTEGSRWEADASSTRMGQQYFEYGMGVMVAGNHVMGCHSPEPNYLPQIWAGSLLSPRWTPGRWCRCRAGIVAAVHGAHTTDVCPSITSLMPNRSPSLPSRRCQQLLFKHNW